MSNTPQPHADDVKLAEDLIQISGLPKEYTERYIPSVLKLLQPLRLSNEALRERVKELEAEIVDREKVHQNLLQDFCGMDDKLTTAQSENARLCTVNKILGDLIKEQGKIITAATEVIEKCERAISFMVPQTRTAIDALDKALTAIKEWKDKSDRKP